MEIFENNFNNIPEKISFYDFIKYVNNLKLAYYIGNITDEDFLYYYDLINYASWYGPLRTIIHSKEVEKAMTSLKEIKDKIKNKQTKIKFR